MKNLIPKFKAYFYSLSKLCVLSLVFLLASLFINAQLHPDFSATSAAGCAPLVVNFQDISTGNPTYWKWDLGNGTISFLQNPSATYFNPGQYTVKLIVKNSQYTDSVIKTQFIKVYALPQVSFSANATSGCFPLPVQFKDLSTEKNGTISKWEWDFGDGELASDQNPSHTYTESGSFNVSLRVTSNFGCVSSVTSLQYIKIATGVTADFTNTNPINCNQPASIQFSNNSSGTGVLSYQWQFGDGSTSTLKDPSHTYSVGSYSVTLIVRNASGCSDTITKSNVIKLATVKADFTALATICQGISVNFLNASNPAPSAATWYFGDGSGSNSINPAKAFTNAGTYNVKLVSGFGSCTDSVTKPIQIIASPGVDFKASKTVSCKAPLAVNFSNLTVGGSTFSWDFGDGTFSTLSSPSHTYLKEGSYSVKLTVTNKSGCTYYNYKPGFIKIQAPVVSINNLPQQGCAPLTNTFTANINSVDTITAYTWKFGDGATSNALSPTHVYNNAGAYTVTLIYATSSGCTDSIKVVNGIYVGTKPIINFSATPRDACASVEVDFSDLTTGNPNQWLWYFGDGATSEVKNPTHNYGDTGYYSVTLIALNNGCADTLISPKYIHVKPPIAKFTTLTNCNQPGHVVFQDASIGADSWKWDFGDGTTSTIINPIHDYAVSGIYVVSLTVTSNTTGCYYTRLDTVNVLKEGADFTSSVNSVCKNAPVIFKAINSIPGNIGLYTWRFGDDITSSDTLNSISHSYKTSGSYNVTLILNVKNGCTDSIVKPLNIKVDGPTAVFSTTIPGACQNSTVTFIDSSYANSTSAIKQWQWNWGDGQIQNFNGPTFQHLYANQGSYSISLKVTDANGCTDSISHQNTIVISKPVALFNGDTLSCTSTAIVFTNLSTGPGLNYTWNFGDSTTFNQANPAHIYNAEGTYSVSLAITDLYGCSSFISKTNYVRIANPKANFIVSDTAGTCPPLVVNFTNLAKNYFSYAWDFGDGSTASSVSPSHFYATPGTFYATLTVKGPGGCTDQKSIRIKVKGPLGSFKYDNTAGCKPLQTNFRATTGVNTTFIWDFNDGTTFATPDSNVSHIYKAAGIYLPKMILVDTAGCKVPYSGSDSIKVYEAFASFTNLDTTLCDSGRIVFTNTSVTNDTIASFLWNFGDQTNSVLPNPIHNYTATGIYTTQLLITTKNGCVDSIKMHSPLKVVASPKVSIDGLPGACTPALLTFKGVINVPDTSALKWQWNFANGNVSTLKNPGPQIYKNSGVYSIQLIAINSSGCKDTVTKLSEAYPLPDLQPTPDTVLCKGASLALTANDAQNYSWNPVTYLSCINCATPVSKPDSAIKYYVTGTSNHGCISTDSVSIEVKFPNTVKVGGADTICLGSSVQLLATGAEVYSWSPSDRLNNPNIASPVASPDATTFYTVTGTDTKRCFTSMAKIPVKVYPIPVVDAGADKTINVGQSFEIIPKLSADITNITWTPSLGVIANNYPGITVKPDQSIEYTIEVKNEGGCNARDRISIYVLCDNSNVFVPNTFSPNGDGVNDIFYPRGTGVFSVKSLRIFSRWGEVVFERANFNANDASFGWDGTYKGKKFSPDVFVYELEVLCSNNQSLVFKGNVALIK